MKNYPFLFLLFLSMPFCFSQNEHKGVILDLDNQVPIEFVNIFNKENHTTTNADGRFLFTSNLDSVIIYGPSYEKIKTRFSQLKDTMYLKKSVLELDEVFVTNKKPLIEDILDSLGAHHSTKPYKEKFLMRSVVKYNSKMHRLQDMQGKLLRNYFFRDSSSKKSKKDFLIELTNMRKLGIKDDDKGAYLELPSIADLYDRMADPKIMKDKYVFKEHRFNNGKNTRLEFNRKPEIDSTATFNGYYIIENHNLAIKEFKIIVKHKNAPYQKSRWLRYRTNAYSVHAFFEAHESNGLYYLKSGKFNADLETTDKENSFSSTYSSSFILMTSDNFGDFLVKANSDAEKDIFKLDHPYAAEYWTQQNQLLLTDEMIEFIAAMGEKNKEFKISSNLD